MQRAHKGAHKYGIRFSNEQEGGLSKCQTYREGKKTGEYVIYKSYWSSWNDSQWKLMLHLQQKKKLEWVDSNSFSNNHTKFWSDVSAVQWLLLGFLFCNYISLCKLTGNPHSRGGLLYSLQERDNYSMLVHPRFICAHCWNLGEILYMMPVRLPGNLCVSGKLVAVCSTLYPYRKVQAIQTVWKFGIRCSRRLIFHVSVYHFCRSQSEEGQAACSSIMPCSSW